MTILIVESPKNKKNTSYLGNDYIVKMFWSH